MKIADYHKKRLELAMRGELASNNPAPTREDHAHEEHEDRPEDVPSNAREGGPEGQGEGGSAGEEGTAREVTDGAIRFHGFLVGPEQEIWAATRKALAEEGTMFGIDPGEKPYLQGKKP